MTIEGFYSIVRTKDNTGKQDGGYQVRSRAVKDLDNLRRVVEAFDGTKLAKVILTPHADYPARVILTAAQFPVVVEALSERVDYTNFKSAVHTRRDQDDKGGAYMDVWSRMLRTELPRPQDKTPYYQAGQRYQSGQRSLYPPKYTPPYKEAVRLEKADYAVSERRLFSPATQLTQREFDDLYGGLPDLNDDDVTGGEILYDYEAERERQEEARVAAIEAELYPRF